jgi:uncharacterized protein
VIDEPQSKALRRFLQSRHGRSSSALALVEVVRAVSRNTEGAVERAFAVLDETDLLDVDDAILRSAASIRDPLLRSLDAIHLASAQVLAENVEALVTYDRRLADAASALGFAVASPS